MDRSCARPRWAPWCATNDARVFIQRRSSIRPPRSRDGVEIGAFAIVGEDCAIGDGSVIASRATLERNVRSGAGVKVGVGTVLGGDPQDLKYRGEPTTVEIGDGTTIREYTTINRGTTQSFKTTVGKNCFLMSYVHLAHDCHIGDGVIISNGTQLAGHVTIDEKAILSRPGGCSSVRDDRAIQLHRRLLARGEGCSALREGRRQSDQAVWAQLGGARAQRVSRRRSPRAQARVSPVLQVGAEPLAGARARRRPSCTRFPRSRSFSRSSIAAIAGRSSDDRSHRRRRRGRARISSYADSPRRAGRAAHRASTRPTPARAAKVASELGVKAFASLDALLDDVDAVSVVVPTPAHYAVAAPALERGLHVLIEKPIADDARGGGRAAGDRAANRRGRADGSCRAIQSRRARGVAVSSSRRGSSRATGLRRSIRAGPTSPSCSI